MRQVHFLINRQNARMEGEANFQASLHGRKLESKAEVEREVTPLSDAAMKAMEAARLAALERIKARNGR